MGKRKTIIHEEDSYPAFIFIPDMSGFTEFMSNSSLGYSQKVITRLLKVMANSNNLSLKMAEIQGDAILFYKLGEPPRIDQVAQQAKKIYMDFGYELKVLAREYDDGDNPFASPENLGLKFVAHYGKCGISNIEGLTKLIGTDVIIAHRLLKNKVNGYEYLLMTDAYLNTQDISKIGKAIDWNQMESGYEEYDHLGEIHYKYASMGPLRDSIPNLSSVA